MIYFVLAALLLIAAIIVAEQLVINKYQKTYSQLSDAELKELESSISEDMEDDWDYPKSLRDRAIKKEWKKRNQKGSTT